MKLNSCAFALIALGPTSISAYYSQQPIIHTANQGSFLGNRVTPNVDEFLSIPFAEPPVGDLRFAKTVPVKPYKGSSHRNAKTPGSICIQPASTDSLPSENQSEDCLQLNIYKPANTLAFFKIPVMVWVYGGSWQEGSIYEPRINATKLISRSINLGEPIIFVTANYRTGAFGFLGGQAILEAQDQGNGVLNAGLWDTMETLDWVKENIASFGGDPSRVTLFGESSGAVNVGLVLMADGGKAAKNLIHGAILESGNPSTGRRLPPTHPDIQGAYDAILGGAGCNNTMSNSDQIACLRSVKVVDLINGNNAAIANAYIAYLPLQDGYFVNGLPSQQYSRGQFLKVPIITGNNLDEGTEFAYPLNVVNDDQFKQASLLVFGSDVEPIFDEILSTWSSDPTKGEPYRPEFFGLNSSDTYYPPQDKNQYKRQASSAQDVFFETGRRIQLAAARAHNVPAWTYRFAQPSAFGVAFDDAGIANASMGVQHESEIPFVFANPLLQGDNAKMIPNPLRTYASDANLKEVSDFMSAAWIHFANYLNPNGRDVHCQWDSYTKGPLDALGNGRQLYIQGGNTSMVYDDLEATQTKWVAEHAKYFWI